MKYRTFTHKLSRHSYHSDTMLQQLYTLIKYHRYCESLTESMRLKIFTDSVSSHAQTLGSNSRTHYWWSDWHWAESVIVRVTFLSLLYCAGSVRVCETRPPVALGSSPELSTFTMSWVASVASSPGSAPPHLLDRHVCVALVYWLEGDEDGRLSFEAQGNWRPRGWWRRIARGWPQGN